MIQHDITEYKAYQCVTNKTLPPVVLDHFGRDIEGLENPQEFVDVVISEIAEHFSIVKTVYETTDPGIFKTHGYFDEYRIDSIEILRKGYSLLDNELFDGIIVNLLIPESGRSQYEKLEEERIACALAIHKLFFDLLFSDHYNTLTGAKTVEEIDMIVLEAKHAKSKVLLKYDPDYIPTEEIKQFVAEKIIALMEHAENMKEFLGRMSITEMKISNIQNKQKPIAEEKRPDVAFDDLFNEPYRNYVDKFIDVLREVTPELINTDGDWIGPKNAGRIYFNELTKHGVIKARISQRSAHKVLGNKFPNLGTSFMRNQPNGTKADLDYGDMGERISILKSTINTKLN